MAFSGNSKLDGEYIIAELDYKIANKWVASLTTLYGNWDATIDRGYNTVGGLDVSNGETDIESTAVRVRLDWLDAFRVLGASITPKVELTTTRTEVDGYTETGGSFPVQFDSLKFTTNELRFGFRADKRANTSIHVAAQLEAVHRFDDTGPRVGVNFNGFAFSLSETSQRQDWLRLGAEIDYEISKKSSLSFSLIGSSQGEDPDLAGAISFKTGF